MDTERWKKFTLAEKMGNLGSEISRAASWEAKQNTFNRNASLERCLEMVEETFDSTISSGGLKELARLQEIIAGCYDGRNENSNTLKFLVDYCIPFALLARKNK